MHCLEGRGGGSWRATLGGRRGGLEHWGHLRAKKLMYIGGGGHLEG